MSIEAMPVVLTKAELAVLAAMAVPSDANLIESLELPPVDGERNEVGSAGLSSLVARDLLRGAGESAELDVVTAAAGVAVAAPISCVSLVIGTSAVPTRVVDIDGARVLLEPVSAGNVKCSMLDASTPLENVVATAVIAAGADDPSLMVRVAFEVSGSAQRNLVLTIAHSATSHLIVDDGEASARTVTNDELAGELRSCMVKGDCQ